MSCKHRGEACWVGLLLLVPLLGCRNEGGATARPAGAPAAAPVAANGTGLADTTFDARPFFGSAVVVTDKGEYIHIFWDAQGAAKEFESPERRGRLVAAAAQLVLDRFPAGAASDIVKVDIVLVKARDEYGKPKWDSLQKLAHFEARATRLKEQSRVAAGRVTGVPEGAFERIEVY
jgi:hypothetical protein